MTKFPDYCIATNAAYELLSGYQGEFPVVDVFSLIELIALDKRIKLCTYSKMAQYCGCSFNEFLIQYASSEHGFTIKQGTRYIVCFNELKDERTIRFTIAHEIGHIVLNHTEDDDVAKKEADCFARNILCPIPISDSFHISTPQEYMNCFNISEPMAEITIKFRRNDKYYITNKNYNKLSDIVYCYFTGYTPAELYGNVSYGEYAF